MTSSPPAALDTLVRGHIYSHAMLTGLLPTIEQSAAALALPVATVRESFLRLAEGHVLVLQPDTGEIIMAHPFSAVPTPFLVQTAKQSYFGNCIWDGLGIPAMLKQDAGVRASCGDCGAAMTLRISGGELEPAEGMIHFALPAQRWYDDIIS